MASTGFGLGECLGYLEGRRVYGSNSLAGFVCQFHFFRRGLCKKVGGWIMPSRRHWAATSNYMMAIVAAALFLPPPLDFFSGLLNQNHYGPSADRRAMRTNTSAMNAADRKGVHNPFARAYHFVGFRLHASTIFRDLGRARILAEVWKFPFRFYEKFNAILHHLGNPQYDYRCCSVHGQPDAIRNPPRALMVNHLIHPLWLIRCRLKHPGLF